MLGFGVLVIGLISVAPMVDADGCYFSESSIAISSDQYIIIVMKGNEISMTFSTAYTGDAEDFGWIIPTPVVPDPENVRETGLAAENVFEILEELTAPILETEGGGSGCFPAGTTVLTRNGPRSIETLKTGDFVYAYNPESKQWTLECITVHHSYRYSGDMITILAGYIRIDATGNHVFMVATPSSDMSDFCWVDARDLRPGDRLYSKEEGILEISEILTKQVEEEVFHLEVASPHTFAVHESGIVVHNGDKDYTEGIRMEQAPLVTIHSTVNLESYEVSILDAVGGDELLLWLSGNGYRVDPAAAKVLDEYIKEGWAFVALKLHPDQGHVENELLPAVTIIYEKDDIVVPMRISSISTESRAAVTLYVVARSTVYSPNYPTRQLDYDAFWEEDIVPELRIEGVINRTLGEAERGTVIMWNGQLEPSRKILRQIRALTNNKLVSPLYVTRLETRINPESMTEDLRLALHDKPLEDFRVSILGDPFDGVTPLMCAIVERQNIDTIIRLISEGGDINMKDHYEATALTHAATFTSDPAVIWELVRAGAEVNVSGALDSLPLYRAVVFNESAPVTAALLMNGAYYGLVTSLRETLIHLAVEYNPNPDIIRILINAGVNIDAQDHLGYTALHRAAFRVGKPEFVELLLELGADSKIRNHRGLTPFATALDHRDLGFSNRQVVDLLGNAR